MSGSVSRASVSFLPPVVKSLLAAGLLFAALASARGETIDGQTLYDQSCSECHPSKARLLRKIPEGSAEEKQVWLAEFLRDHHAPEETAREHLIIWLSTQ